VNDVFGSLPDAHVWMSQMATFSWLRLPDLRPLFKKGTSRTFDPNAALPSFENMTRDVDVLLSYAATAGISLRDADVTNLTSGENNKTAFIQSYSRVALALIPVTAFALRKFFASYRQNVRFYVIGGILLAIIVIFFLYLLSFLLQSPSH
jgi:lipopolysaccharide export LptBFGC system permease protein LptF